MPVLLHRVVKVHRRAAVLVLRHTNVVQEKEGEVAQLRFASQEVGNGTEEHIVEGGHQQDEEGPGVTVPHKVHRLRELCQLHEHQQGPKQVRPHVDCLVVALEQGEEVVPPALVQRAVAGMDVALPEEARHFRVSHGAWHGRGGFGQHLGNLPKLLQVDE